MNDQNLDEILNSIKPSSKYNSDYYSSDLEKLCEDIMKDDTTTKSKNIESIENEDSEVSKSKYLVGVGAFCILLIGAVYLTNNIGNDGAQEELVAASQASEEDTSKDLVVNMAEDDPAESKVKGSLSESSEKEKEKSESDKKDLDIPETSSTNSPEDSAESNQKFPTLDDMVEVQGIYVDSSISANLKKLLEAAEEGGVNLSGSGFVSSEKQINLRKQNCGVTEYDIYEKPASECSPVTPRPADLTHLKGLAIDFAYNGDQIRSKTDPGYIWLNANAEKYGLSNLPAEPWHWSTTGK